MISNQVGRALGVPRGLLRLLVLEMLSEKPMSGTEIAKQIEKQTGGRWKPSPGSIYPLLAWMLEKGFTKDSLKEGGLKRYALTAEGSKFLNRQIEHGQDFLNKLEFLLPMLVGGLQFGQYNEKLREMREPAGHLVNAFMAIRHNLKGLSQKDTKELAQALDECSERLDKIAQKLGEKRKN